MKRLCLIVAALLLSVAAGAPCWAESLHALTQRTFERLDAIRELKQHQIEQLLGQVERKAKQAAEDETLLKFFHVMNRDKEVLALGASVPEKLRQVATQYQNAMNTYYLNTYREFYDILFIDSSGFVFHSMRKEDDYRANVFQGALKHTRLAHCLRTPEYEFFIDFQHYSPTDEPAAFFLLRIYDDGVHRGWIVFQYALNMLNALLVDRSELGETGEVYIVNRDQYMLTPSRFRPGNSCLDVRVDTEAVRCALKERCGHKRIRGYRDRTVFVSFARFTMWDTSWIIIASIEEDEILTDYYRAHGDRCLQKMLSRLEKKPPHATHAHPPDGRMLRVDMDEYAKALPGVVARTYGVSTCTAVTVGIPGRFCYLAHISSNDKIYGSDKPLHSLKDMVRTITHFDIHLCELSQLRFVVVATHTRSIAMVVEKLLKYGIMLSQIRFACNPRARYANVFCEGASGRTGIEWVYDTRDPDVMDDRALSSLAAVLKAVEDYR